VISPDRRTPERDDASANAAPAEPNGPASAEVQDDQRFPMPGGSSAARWTGTPARTILPGMTTPAPRCPTCGSLLTRDTRETHSLLASGERLTPWMLHDLPRIAWIVEYRATELTDEERQLVRDATARMLDALERETG
jgi:hypothetical protein